MLERLLDYRLSVVELACIAAFLGIPYAAIGIVWASSHSAPFEQLQGVRLTASLLGSVLLWSVVALSGCA
ncbi:hypothetical protein MSP7336_04084 [Mycobacterium shimoidei]|uniref:Uncharacterized protein n=1 Tax=Mycobacterium shimoidei TaxID=29313 RepID=A0A375Z3S8_MYCSH|nr:hypothetical protein [Mycobacterium shimoidei]SRX95811.1 hypothetical protein MSP7336_04084 [Mycobacterium shimoidei]